jgi:serine/threonine protein kinase
MASVWVAVNESTGKQVALKVIRAGFMETPGAEALLRSEGLAASRINHPNVVTVFDVVEHDGMACIVMELLDGLPLGTYIERFGPLSLRDAVGLLLPAMRGVAAAHAQGVVHRDLKPQNIFVCIGPDARIVTTKVLDFGISLMVDWARGNAVSALPGVVGTAAYMAPEHVEGSTALDPRTDVYGFGLLLYEALSGRMAFEGEAGPELLKRVLHEPPVPLRELRPDLPLGVIVAIETAMDKRPERRFDGLNEMVGVLEEQLAIAAPATGGTPASGVPTNAMAYSVSGSVPIAIPSHIGREPSGAILKTQIFGQSARPEAEPATPKPEPTDGAAPRLGLVASFAPVTPARAVIDAGPPTELVSRRMRWILARLRDWRVQAGAGIALLLLLILIVAAKRSPSESLAAPMPPSPANVPASVPAAAAAPAVPVVVPIPVPSAKPQAPGTEAPASLPEAPSIPEPAAVAAVEPPASVQVARPAARRRASSPGVPKGKPATARRSRSTKASVLRAGSLSEEDF